MKRSLLLLFGVAGLVLLLDRWTKHWAATTLPFDRPVPVLGEFLRLTYTRNSGVAFGLGQGTGFPWYVFSIAAVLVILWMFLRHRVDGVSRQLALALILGGALGNLVDRLRTGEVVDFIEVGVRRDFVSNHAETLGVLSLRYFYDALGAATPADQPDSML